MASKIHVETSVLWEEWVSTNLSRGCDREEMRRLLLEGGHSSEQIALLLGSSEHVPDLPVAKKSICDNSTIEEVTHHSGMSVFLPLADRLETDKAEIYRVDKFLSEEECIRLIEAMRQDLKPSTVTEGCPLVRTSRTCNFTVIQDPIVEEIDQRICRYMGIASSQSERIQGQWYEPGQEFKEHTDYFEPGSPSTEFHIGQLGQRSWTFMIYLNTTRAGGDTNFPELGMRFSTAAGSAVIWNNRDGAGELNENTMHHGMPVLEGFKAIVTKWFRSKEPKTRYEKSQNEYLPPLTRTGFLKTRIPDNLFLKLLGFYNAKRFNTTDEYLPDYIRSDSNQSASVLIQLTDELRQDIHASLLQVVQAWIGDYLTATHVYGIREYRNGSVLDVHRDRFDTHVASAILNIGQHVTTDWLLYIEDHMYRPHEISLQPGEMLLYEGARLNHGRPAALDGSSYANVFAHYKLKSDENNDNLTTIRPYIR